MLNTQNIIDKLKNQGIEADTSQIKLITELVDLNIKKKGFLETYLTKNIKKSGIYIWGDVGRGKTLVSKTYLQSITNKNVKNFHYIDLMKYVHKKLTEYAGKKNPLEIVKNDLCKECELIFIDEFQVEDIADAMIIGNLLLGIINKGLILILTSNAHPNDLYKDGLQRKKFLDAIKILTDKMKVFHLDQGIDYRSLNIINLEVDDKNSSDKEIEKIIKENFESEDFVNTELKINDRNFECKQVVNNMLWIDFNAFFKQPTGSNDYIHICDKFDWIFVSGFIECDDDSADVIRRFISFIDISYKEKTKVKFFFKNLPISKIYNGSKLGVIWDRCESRLSEMNSFNHLD